jgi:hypothetical protein
MNTFFQNNSLENPSLTRFDTILVDRVCVFKRGNPAYCVLQSKVFLYQTNFKFMIK